MIESFAEKSHQELAEIAVALSQDNVAQAKRIVALEAEIALFQERFRLAMRKQFGSSSEKTSALQYTLLFNEAEVCAVPDLPEPPVEVVVRTGRKTVGHREAQLADLPIEEIPYELPKNEQVCPVCSGELHEMGTEVRQEIKIIPAKVVVVHHKRTKYACRCCQKEETSTPVLTAVMPKPAFPNSIASASAVAYIMTEKFVMGSPLYRLEQQLRRNGLELYRQTMANWMIRGASWLEAIYERMHDELLSRDNLHADETTIQVLQELGRDPVTNSYMWLYRTGREGPPIILFDYQTTRAGQHPKNFLRYFKGSLNVDGYVGYDPLSEQMTLIGCWSHARRKFDEAIKAILSAAIKAAKTPLAAQVGLQFCNELYKIESDLKDKTAAERYDARLELSRPVLDKFKLWLDEQAPKVLPQSALGKAITYCRNQWTKLTAFLSDGRIEIDNNRAERSIKPFVIGRKNWLFANTPKGARSSAIIYSIVETAKENGLNPFEYLTHLFEALPNIDIENADAVAQLLPWAENIQAKCAVQSRKQPQ